MARKAATTERKLRVVRRYYAIRKEGGTRRDAAAVAGASIPTIDKWEKELEAEGFSIWGTT